MNNPFKQGVLTTIILVAVSLLACHKEQDEVTPAGDPGTVKVHRLTQVGKMKVYYTNDGTHIAQIEKADDGHHRIQYDYQKDNKILVSHYYDNLLRWTTLIQLDENGRCASSKSTDLTASKKYVADEQELFYTYNAKGQLTKVSAFKIAANNLSGYKFEYYSDNSLKANNLRFMTQTNSVGKILSKAEFDYGQFELGNKFINCSVDKNKGDVNQVLHLTDWGAEPFSDIIDFFLPIYGTMNLYAVNYIVLTDSNNLTLLKHNIGYSLTDDGYIENVYTHDESTIPYTYEMVDFITSPPVLAPAK